MVFFFCIFTLEIYPQGVYNNNSRTGNNRIIFKSGAYPQGEKNE